MSEILVVSGWKLICE